MIVVALDLSLTGTGWASLPGGSGGLIESSSRVPIAERLDRIVQTISVLCLDADLVVIEGPSFNSKGSGSIDRYGLRGALLVELYRMGTRHIEVPPASLKKYGTGKGNASKDLMVAEAVRRFGFPGCDNNEADAWILARLASDMEGERLVELPESHLRALDKLHEIWNRND